MIAIDIETYSNAEMLDKLPEVKPAGNLKDPAKIAESIETKRKEQIEKMALSPLYGKIACIGLYNDTIQKVLIDTEKEMITEFLELIKEKTLYTWNGKGFDLDFIIKRGVLNGVCKLEDLKQYTDKYKAENHIDLMQVWCSNSSYLGLNEVSNIVLGEQKIEFDFTEIPELIQTEDGQAKLSAYCLKDAELTYKLAKVFGYAN